MDGVNVNNVTSKVVLLGDNNFYSGKITLAAGAKLAAGAILKRGATQDEYAVATSVDEYTAVNPFEIENKTAAPKVFGFRACVDGRVRMDMLRVGAATVTNADIDKLRKIGILPVKVTDLSHLDNQ
jgi:hypothetical protein